MSTLDKENLSYIMIEFFMVLLINANNSSFEKFFVLREEYIFLYIYILMFNEILH